MKFLKITLLSIVVGVTTSTAFSIWEKHKAQKNNPKYVENYSDILDERKKEKRLEKIKERVENEVPRSNPVIVETYHDETTKISAVDPDEPNLSELKDIGDEKDLRYDSNSIKAWMQFMNYMLSDFDEDSRTKFILYKLFDTEFVPSDVDDETLVSRCMDKRLEFFGENSKYYGDSTVSLAEVILDFSQRADFDYDHGVPFWAEEIINDLPIDESTSLEELCALCQEIADLDFRQDVTKYYLYGLFALRDDEMQAGTDESLMKQFEDWEISHAQNVD